MKYYFYMLLLFVLTSCSTKINRPEIKGYVYDFETKQPISDVTIITEEGKETTTDKLGHFVLSKQTRTKIFDFESGHDPKHFFFILSHPKFNSDTIKEETRGSFGDLKHYDSIYLKRK
ncbi:hypothetical protein Q1W71_22835 [Flavobacterium pectinovorum]|uniref:hypothetical protein n=1 Tax=Flavobacterium pectinovorum TaxID=29533 RepID=UPI00265FC89B|nr:hypothetical protein [Flavobacterium pectinovorum]WKL47770.1 hypothetical protein Q1W71_22835 [Flavobacterium pectinovorum]